MNELLGALAPDGALLVGATESLMRFDLPVRCDARAGTFFYRKAATP